MSVDTTVLLSLVLLALAAFAVGASGWVLFARDHRAWKAAHAGGNPDTGADVEGS